jgi:hypothetical protein
MALPTLPTRAPGSRPSVRASAAPLACAIAALGFVAALASACGDDPLPTAYLGEGGAAPSGSYYGQPYVPGTKGAGGTAGTAGTAGSAGRAGSAGTAGSAGSPGAALPLVEPRVCEWRLFDRAASAGGGAGGAAGAGGTAGAAGAADGCEGVVGEFALSAVRNVRVVGGNLEASFGGKGYQVTLAEGCPLPGALCQPAARAVDSTRTVFAWARLGDGRRVAVTEAALELLPVEGDVPLGTCPLPLPFSADLARARRHVAFDPADPLHVWVVDGGTTLYERRLASDAASGAVTCQTADNDIAVGEPVALQGVAAGAGPGQLWLAVAASSEAEGSLAQVWGVTVAGNAIADSSLRWPQRSGACSAGGLFSADAVAALPDGVAVADGACGAVVRLRATAADGPTPATLTPVDRATLPAGDAPRALAATPDGLFVATAIARPEGPSVGFVRVLPPPSP